MLPQQRNEATIEAAIERVGKALNAAENSNQRGEDLIVAMANGPDLYEALKELVQAHDAITRHNGRHTLENFEEYRALVVRADAADVQARAALSKVTGEAPALERPTAPGMGGGL